MVLADTSVWIRHLRTGGSELTALLDDAEVVCHPWVIGELACGRLDPREATLSLLGELPALPSIDLDECLHFVGAQDLAGSGLGLVDVQLLGSAQLVGVPLWTLDRALALAARRLGLGHPG